MSLSDAYRCARSLEAIENYARADNLILDVSQDLNDPSDHPVYLGGPYPDETFWYDVLSNPEFVWGRDYRLQSFALSEY